MSLDKFAATVRLGKLLAAAKKIKHCGDYGLLFFQPATGTVHWTMGDADGSEKDHTTSAEIKKLLGAIPGVSKVVIGDEWSPSRKDPGWINLTPKLDKQAAAGWHGVDLDGTLAEYDKWKGDEYIGRPIKKMADRVKRWLADGEEVRILSTRGGKGAAAIKPVEDWCLAHFGKVLPVTNEKDEKMIDLWDDRAHRVGKNTGVKLAQMSQIPGAPQKTNAPAVPGTPKAPAVEQIKGTPRPQAELRMASNAPLRQPELRAPSPIRANFWNTNNPLKVMTDNLIHNPNGERDSFLNSVALASTAVGAVNPTTVTGALALGSKALASFPRVAKGLQLANRAWQAGNTAQAVATAAGNPTAENVGSAALTAATHGSAPIKRTATTVKAMQTADKVIGGAPPATAPLPTLATPPPARVGVPPNLLATPPATPPIRSGISPMLLAKQGTMVKEVPLKIVAADKTTKGQLSAEVAATPWARATGLSKRSDVPDGTGMLFDTVGPFWMKDTWVPLDLLFLTKEGTVLECVTMPVVEVPDYMQPRYVTTKAGAAMALEVPAGWCARQGITPGDRVVLEE